MFTFQPKKVVCIIYQGPITKLCILSKAHRMSALLCSLRSPWTLSIHVCVVHIVSSRLVSSAHDLDSNSFCFLFFWKMQILSCFFVCAYLFARHAAYVCTFCCCVPSMFYTVLLNRTWKVKHQRNRTKKKNVVGIFDPHDARDRSRSMKSSRHSMIVAALLLACMYFCHVNSSTNCN